LAAGKESFGGIIWLRPVRRKVRRCLFNRLGKLSRGEGPAMNLAAGGVVITLRR
jgi:hypothetical protein